MFGKFVFIIIATIFVTIKRSFILHNVKLMIAFMSIGFLLVYKKSKVGI